MLFIGELLLSLRVLLLSSSRAGAFLQAIRCFPEREIITRKVTTVCNGKREVWTDYEEAKAYFLELMMSTDGEEHERAECVYIQLLHGLEECSDEDG